ncbi:hybrid sensor histidine kinase/response regulator [Natronosalvus halobius]|uniref:hybrid sensor histidine kinase/response regulator n=1 Tax=Natronosalvus halobius TaxID=2953746 RepID=UPI00209DA578|nr:PAS domain S-box protein [Natronosalvus halobius]USZ72099.1 PAS domain S-box protein [Natronosalvus halobius]
MSGGGSGGQRAFGGGSIVYVDPTDRAPRVVDALESSCPGLSVHRAETAADAVRALDNRSVDGVVTVDRLPDSDGLALVETIRRTHPTLPIVLYARHGSEELASRAIDADVTAYVPAAFDGPADAVEHLCDRVERVLASTGDGRFRRVDAMHDVALEFETCHDPETVYRLAVEAMIHVLESDDSALYVEEDGVLRPAAANGAIVSELTETFEPDQGVVGRTYRSGESSLDLDIGSDEDADPVADELRSGLSVPVGSFGVLQATSRDAAAFTERDRTLAELLAAHVSAAISRIRSERAVRRERDRFGALFENVPDGVVVVSEPGLDRIVAANPGFERLFGYEADEVAGEILGESLLPAGEDVVPIYDAVGLDEVVTEEVTRLTVDGPREFLLRGFAVELDGTIYEYIIYTDVTERKRRERELEEYRTLVETVGDPMYVLDADGTVAVANDAMAEAVGQPRSAILGAHARSFMPESTLERGKRELRAILQEDRQWGTFEFEFTDASDRTHVAEANVAPLVDDGDLVGNVGVIRDIAARKEREQRIRALHDGTRRLMAAENAPEVATVGCALATDILEYPLTGIHRYDPEADGLVPIAVSDDVADLLDEPDVIERDGGLAWTAFDSGQVMAHGDVRREEGVRNPETAIRSEAHFPLGEYGVLIVSSTERDAFDEESLAIAKILAANVEAALERAERETELDRRRRELERQRRELERQNERLEEFAGTVSHDLRNPLTLATGHVDILATEREEEHGDHLSEVQWALDRMDDIIDDVLVLARSGRQLTDTESISLETVVRRAGRTVDPALDIDVEGSLPAVTGEETRLLALFENLFRNALEHVGSDVSLTVGSFDDGFYVADDGPGIPPDEREAVLESGYTTHPEGTGFGLAIVTEVVDAHGWEIAVTESKAGGARFDVSLGKEAGGVDHDQDDDHDYDHNYNQDQGDDGDRNGDRVTQIDTE